MQWTYSYLAPLFLIKNKQTNNTAYQIFPGCTAINLFISTQKCYCLCCPQPSCIKKSQWRVSSGKPAKLWQHPLTMPGAATWAAAWGAGVFRLRVCWAWPPCSAPRLSSLGRGLDLKLVSQVNSPGNGKKSSSAPCPIRNHTQVRFPANSNSNFLLAFYFPSYGNVLFPGVVSVLPVFPHTLCQEVRTQRSANAYPFFKCFLLCSKVPLFPRAWSFWELILAKLAVPLSAESFVKSKLTSTTAAASRAGGRGRCGTCWAASLQWDRLHRGVLSWWQSPAVPRQCRGALSAAPVLSQVLQFSWVSPPLQPSIPLIPLTAPSEKSVASLSCLYFIKPLSELSLWLLKPQCQNQTACCSEKLQLLTVPFAKAVFSQLMEFALSSTYSRGQWQEGAQELLPAQIPAGQAARNQGKNKDYGTTSYRK